MRQGSCTRQNKFHIFLKLKLIPGNRGPSCRAKRRASPIEHFLHYMPLNSNSSPPRCRFETLVSFALLSFLLFGSQTALAVPPPAGVAPVTVPAGGFGIDGDLFANMPGADVGDWVTNSASGGGVLTRAGVPLNALTTLHFTDQYNGNDIIFSGGLKWTDDPNIWTWTTGKASGKTDIKTSFCMSPQIPTATVGSRLPPTGLARRAIPTSTSNCSKTLWSEPTT